MTKLRGWTGTMVIVGLALCTSGCFLRFLTGHGIDELGLRAADAKAGGVDTLRVRFTAEATLAPCNDSSYPGYPGRTPPVARKPVYPVYPV